MRRKGKEKNKRASALVSWHYTILADGQQHAYGVRRSRRARHVLLHVDARGEIEVVLPWRMSGSVAHQFVAHKKAWLQRCLDRYQVRGRTIPRRTFTAGEYLPLLGHEYILTLCQREQSRRSRVELAGSYLTVTTHPQTLIRPVLARWYRRQAREYFSRVCQELGAPRGIHIRSIRIGEQTTQWGSCSGQGRLSFNWRLVLGPEVIAYSVAAHEVAHLQHANHSPAFWQMVSAWDPSYAQHRRWLRQHGHQLVL